MEGRHSAEPDPTVVRMVVAGSHAALAELYDRHAAAVFRASFRLLGQRLEAEEVVQETFLALWNRAEQFDPGLGSLRAWLMTIARNRAIDRLRASGRQPSVVSFGMLEDDASSRQESRGVALDRPELTADDDASDPERQAELATLRVTVRGALDTLPGGEREALVLAYFQGLTQQEIATRLEWPLGTVKTRTRRALRRLRLTLGSLVDPAGEGALLPELSTVRPGDPDGPR
jgi:RNA polymerase sigma-70 factor, ECF subfamily